MADIRWNEGIFNRTFHTPGGMVGRDLKKRARRVQIAAKAQVGVDTGQLRSMIRTDVSYNSRLGLHARIGTWVEPGVGIAFWHHHGTRPHVIAARGDGHLRFMGRGRAVAFATEVMHPGSPANKYLSDNLFLGVM